MCPFEIFVVACNSAIKKLIKMFIRGNSREFSLLFVFIFKYENKGLLINSIKLIKKKPENDIKIFQVLSNLLGHSLPKFLLVNLMKYKKNIEKCLMNHLMRFTLCSNWRYQFNCYSFNIKFCMNHTDRIVIWNFKTWNILVN